nr:Crp/Fnr family transcriptional regulator [Muribaculaceae bacterium]
MGENFNTYITGIAPDFWKDLIIREGELRHYDRGEEFASIGHPAPYLGYVKSGTLKYAVWASDGTERVIGLEFAGEFVADFPFSLYGEKSRVSIVAVSECEIYCLPVDRAKQMLDSDPMAKDIVARSTQAIFSTVYDRYVALYTLTPQERYADIVSRHPDLFTLFPL